MPPEGTAPGTPADWLRHARSDLALAQVSPSRGVLLEGLCFHAQQAAEKALKALLVASSIPIPRTHNIRTLLDVLGTETSVPEEMEDAAILTDYAVMTRYPGDYEAVDRDEYEEAVRGPGRLVGRIARKQLLTSAERRRKPL